MSDDKKKPQIQRNAEETTKMSEADYWTKKYPNVTNFDVSGMSAGDFLAVAQKHHESKGQKWKSEKK